MNTTINNPTPCSCSNMTPEATVAQAIDPDAGHIGTAIAARKPFTWYAMLIAVPLDWKAHSWRSGGPSASMGMPHAIAVQSAITINTQRMRSAANHQGRVQHWVVRIEASGSSKLMTLELPGGMRPKSAIELPPCAVPIQSTTREEMKQVLGDLNGLAGPGRRWIRILPMELPAPEVETPASDDTTKATEAPSVTPKADHGANGHKVENRYNVVDRGKVLLPFVQLAYANGYCRTHNRLNEGAQAEPVLAWSPERGIVEPATEAPQQAHSGNGHQDGQTVSQTEQPANGATWRPSAVHVTPGTKSTGYRVGLTHPQFGIVALSDQAFDPRDCDSILSHSSACLVGAANGSNGK